MTVNFRRLIPKFDSKKVKITWLTFLLVCCRGKEGTEGDQSETVENDLVELNGKKRKIIGIIGMFIFGLLLFDYLSLFPIKALDSFIPWWIYVILPFFISMLFMLSFYLVLS